MAVPLAEQHIFKEFELADPYSNPPECIMDNKEHAASDYEGDENNLQKPAQNRVQIPAHRLVSPKVEL